jgi:hypothetical protein
MGALVSQLNHLNKKIKTTSLITPRCALFYCYFRHIFHYQQKLVLKHGCQNIMLLLPTFQIHLPHGF